MWGFKTWKTISKFKLKKIFLKLNIDQRNVKIKKFIAEKKLDKNEKMLQWWRFHQFNYLNISTLCKNFSFNLARNRNYFSNFVRNRFRYIPTGTHHIMEFSGQDWLLIINFWVCHLGATGKYFPLASILGSCDTRGCQSWTVVYVKLFSAARSIKSGNVIRKVENDVRKRTTVKHQ